MDFVFFLHRQGRLTADAALDALEAWSRARTPLGRLAVERGLLKVPDVMRVLDHQASERPSPRFGEAAVALGLLEADEVDQLLRAQQEALPPLERHLVRQGTLTADELPELWWRYLAWTRSD
jgi:hypothetical protein